MDGRKTPLLEKFAGLDPMKIIIGIAFLLVVVAIIIVIAVPNREEGVVSPEAPASFEQIGTRIDPVSGEVVITSEFEPEGATAGVMVLGMAQLTNLGVSTDQMMEIIGFLREYFDNRAEVVSYLRGSFRDGRLTVVVDERDIYIITLVDSAIEIESTGETWGGR